MFSSYIVLPSLRHIERPAQDGGRDSVLLSPFHSTKQTRSQCSVSTLVAPIVVPRSSLIRNRSTDDGSDLSEQDSEGDADANAVEEQTKTKAVDEGQVPDTVASAKQAT